jgi:NAD(P)-dependent dehydrogenase (short-subunit alcohol dehydrogenase family)
MKIDGKTVLITGSTDGVGRYVAARLAAAGANVLIHGRDEARAKSLADDIRRQGHAEPTFYPAYLSPLSGARQPPARGRAIAYGRVDAVLASHALSAGRPCERRDP